MQRKTLAFTTLLLILALVSTPAAFANEIRTDISPSGIAFDTDVAHRALALRVVGEGQVVEYEFDGQSRAFFSPSEYGLPDGTYHFKLVVAPDVERLARAATRNGGAEEREPLIASGTFTIQQGSIVADDVLEPGEPVGGGNADGLVSSREETTISGDLTVYNSLCVGTDCAASENYGADTIRLKENNLRIHFNDTSTSGSFPTTDWRLEANSQSNGGASYFSVINADTGSTKLYLDKSAKTNAIYATSAGVGIAENAPVVELHVSDGDTPTLRLEQDQSSGFAARTWDIAGNETNFFVRDVLDGSALPFRIFPGTGDDSLVLRGGKVGIGTDNPSETVHLVGSDSPQLLIEDTVDNTNDKPGLEIKSPASEGGGVWRFETDNAGNFQIDYSLSAGAEILVSDNPAGNSTVTIAGNLVVNGTCTGCDGVFEPDFGLESIEEHAELMWKNNYLPGVGPTPDGATSIDVFQKTTGILQELEKAHIYIEQLHGAMKEMQAKIEALEGRIE